MTEEQIIEQIIHSFTNFCLRDILEINNINTDFTIAEFILCSCLIDQVSGFRYNTNSVGKRYKQFVKDYLPNYKPDELYYDLRNKLVHNYSVGRYFGLMRGQPDWHLKLGLGLKYLNLENFIEDLQSAIEKFCFELKSNLVIRENAIKWYNKHKIITLTGSPKF